MTGFAAASPRLAPRDSSVNMSCLSDLYHNYGFQILFYVAVAALIFVFLYNAFVGNRGTYSRTHQRALLNLIGAAGNDGQLRAAPQQPFESRGERECRRAIEALTGRKFPKQRPAFLRNAITAANLELDCYNADLRLAIEYNGAQHYAFVPRFHRTMDGFYNMRYRDDMKRRLCAENGVRLIVVPYTTPIDRIEGFLRESVKKLPVSDK
jgi:hypothetical protein